VSIPAGTLQEHTVTGRFSGEISRRPEPADVTKKTCPMSLILKGAFQIGSVTNAASIYNIEKVVG
jgi:hypothetical protein